MAGSSDLSLWGRFTPEQVEEMRGRFAVQARFPGLTADQLRDVRTVLAGIPGVPPAVFEQIDIILTNCRAMHDNSRALWALLGAAQFLPLGEAN